MEPLNVARERQARLIENNPKPSAEKRARVYDSSFSFALINRPLLIKRPLGLAGLDKTAIGLDKTATAGRPLDKAAIRLPVLANNSLAWLLINCLHGTI